MKLDLSDTQFRLICISLSGTLFQLTIFIVLFNQNAQKVKHLYSYILLYALLTIFTTYFYFKIYGNT